MITMTLTRKETDIEGTFGILESEALLMQTGELPWENNAIGESCIPPGEYLCKPHESPRHGKCYWLQDVPGRTEILIHAANYMGDTDSGLKSHLAGCIAVGFGRGEDQAGQDMILKSRAAIAKLIMYNGWQPFMLRIVNETGVPMS